MDSMLLPFLMTSDESEADKLLADLCRCAVPAVESIVRSMFGGPLARAMNNGARLIEDADDIVGEVNVKILDRLRRLKESQNEDNINDFMGYVAGTAYNVCNAYVRLKYLNWHNLRKRIRNTLTRHAEFALWD